MKITKRHFCITSILVTAFTLVTTGLRADDPPSGPPEKDREAILKMAGNFEVLFNFEETLSLQKDYEITDPYQEDAEEKVFVVEDSGDRIVMQHILLAGSHVVKHWKQVWTWEDTRITEFQGHQTWKNRTIDSAEAKGTWSQLVTQTDDSPRYESFGEWKHLPGYSYWESQPTARPLPRREYKKRDDYEVLLTVNRHSITPHGWAHEQDSVKVKVNDEFEPVGYIAREIGTNYYDTADAETDFTAAEKYWNGTKDFWAIVSKFWEKTSDEQDQFSIVDGDEGKAIGKEISEMASEVKKGGEVPSADEINKVLARSLVKSSE